MFNFRDFANTRINGFKLDDNALAEYKEFKAETKAVYEQTMNDEFSIIDLRNNTIMSRNISCSFIHSASMIIHSDKIEIYNTTYCKFFDNYQKFEKKVFENTEENLVKAEKMLRKLDSKLDPKKLGLQICPECGSWAKHVDFQNFTCENC